MPRNDRSDSLSIRGADDPRRPLKAMQQEAELEFGWNQSHDTGGVEHQGQEDRAGRSAERTEPKEGGPSRSAGLPPDREREPDDAPLAPEKREESGD